MTNKSNVLKILKNKGFTLGSAESLTGGLFASEVTSIPGASSVFKGAIVSYNADVKSRVLGVNHKDIDSYGVVSESVASQMALGALDVLDVDVAVSFTGNAGPTCEPGGAKVGEVYMAIVIKNNHNENTVFNYHEFFNGDRNTIRNNCVDYIFEQLKDILK